MNRGKQSELTEAEKRMLAGHRDRLKKRFLSQKVDDMDDSRMLELLLTYALARKDTYPLAVNLLIEFGGLDNILNASIDDLCAIEGIGENTAILIKLISALDRKAMLARNKRITLNTTELIAAKFCQLFTGVREERIYMLTFDSQMKLQSSLCIGEGSPSECIIDKRKITKALVRDNIAHVALAHNHPNGDIAPTTSDLNSTAALQKLIKSMGVDLVEAFIVHENRYFKMSDAHKLLDHYENRFDEEFSYLYKNADIQCMAHWGYYDEVESIDNFNYYPDEDTTEK